MLFLQLLQKSLIPYSLTTYSPVFKVCSYNISLVLYVILSTDVHNLYVQLLKKLRYTGVSVQPLLLMKVIITQSIKLLNQPFQ